MDAYNNPRRGRRPIVCIGLWLVQIMFACALIGVSVANVIAFTYSKVSMEYQYCVFVGVFGVVTSLIGFWAMWESRIPLGYVIALNTIFAALIIAGGVSSYLQTGELSCTVDTNNALNMLLANPLINLGDTTDSTGHPTVGIVLEACGDPVNRCAKLSVAVASRCHVAMAVESVLMMLAIVCTGSLVFTAIDFKAIWAARHIQRDLNRDVLHPEVEREMAAQEAHRAIQSNNIETRRHLSQQVA